MRKGDPEMTMIEEIASKAKAAAAALAFEAISSIMVISGSPFRIT